MIPLIKPTMPDLIKAEAYLDRSRTEKQFTNFGPLHRSLVQRLSIITNSHALPVTSGTTAIEVALLVLGLKGKKVAVPDFTHSGTFLAVTRAGAKPVIMSSSVKTWTLDMELLEEYLEEYDAFIVTSPFGYSVDVAKYDKFAEKYGKLVIYDFAGAWGFFPLTNNPVCYSFHSTKNFGVGEGGMACFDSAEQWEAGRKIINFGTLEDRSIESDSGFNGKIDEFKCALIHSQLDDKDLITQKIINKSALIHYYSRELGIKSQPHEAPSMCVFSGFDTKELQINGLENYIIFKQYYPLLSEMRGIKSAKKIIRTNTIKYFMSCCALPSDVNLSDAQIVASFAKAYKLGK